jgi:hypothetical protein
MVGGLPPAICGSGDAESRPGVNGEGGRAGSEAVKGEGERGGQTGDCSDASHCRRTGAKEEG